MSYTPGVPIPAVRLLSTTAPLTGGGDLSADRTLAVSDFVASGASHARGTVPDPGASGGTTKYLREDATWAAPQAGGGGNSGAATLDFGASGSTSATVTVTGQAWVTGTSKIVAMVMDDARAEDAVIEGLTLSIANRVAGTGFDIYGAPHSGDFMSSVDIAFVGV